MYRGSTRKTDRRSPSATEKAESEKPINLREHYTKYEYRIPMRDGVKLFTAVYVPKDQSTTYPFLVNRTPYSVSAADGADGSRNYGVDHFPPETRHLGPSEDFDRAGLHLRFPRHPRVGTNRRANSWRCFRITTTSRARTWTRAATCTTPSTSLLKNVPNNNGKVGIWGISYPGFLTSASVIDSHPAIKARFAAGPDDGHLHGRRHVPRRRVHARGDVRILFGVQVRRVHPDHETGQMDAVFDYGTQDGYEFFLKNGTFADLNKLFPEGPELGMGRPGATHHLRRLLEGTKPRAAPQEYTRCAVLTVGGWYDAEDLQGPFLRLQGSGRTKPGQSGTVWSSVRGSTAAGARYDGHRLGHVNFDADTGGLLSPVRCVSVLRAIPQRQGGRETRQGDRVRDRHQCLAALPELAAARSAEDRNSIFSLGGGLKWQAPVERSGGRRHDEYVSDPAKPVPFIGYTALGVPQEYMVADQRFAAKRTDVLTYQTEPLGGRRDGGRAVVAEVVRFHKRHGFRF